MQPVLPEPTTCRYHKEQRAMPGDDRGEKREHRLRYEEIDDPQFQRKWMEARHLDGVQVEAAFRHGFDSRGRFADRPFHEIEHYLRESWEGMGPPAPWDEVVGIVRSGYERYKGAGFGRLTDEVDEALGHLPDLETIAGSRIGGVMGDRPMLGAAEPVPEFDGEGGPPVGGHELDEDGPAVAGSDVSR
ncbi:MAG TPA: hypothetical protein VF158_06075 [Longimicrobiales bacterium]